MAVSLLVLGAVALVFAVFVQTKASNTAESAVPIDPNNAGPDTVLAEAGGVSVSTPIRPANLTGLGYHPEGESLAAMEPRGKNLSANAFLVSSRGERLRRGSTTTLWTPRGGMDPRPVPSTSAQRQVPPSTPL